MLTTNRVTNGMTAAKLASGAASNVPGSRRSISFDFGIDFVSVAESHVLMFSRMKDYVYGEIQDVSVFESIARSDACHLGRWLEANGKEGFGHLSAFDRLVTSHAEFHGWADEVLSRMNDGSWMAAERVLKQDLSRSLRRILIALTELNEAATAAKNDIGRIQAWAVS